MNREKERIFDLMGKKFKVEKLDALNGSDLLRIFTNSGNNNPQQFLATMPTEQFRYIQSLLFEKLYRIREIEGKETVMPIVLPSGTVDVEVNDSGILFMLTVVALMFNLSGFFEESTLKEFQDIVKSFNVLNQ